MELSELSFFFFFYLPFALPLLDVVFVRVCQFLLCLFDGVVFVYNLTAARTVHDWGMQKITRGGEFAMAIQVYWFFDLLVRLRLFFVPDDEFVRKVQTGLEADWQKVAG